MLGQTLTPALRELLDRVADQEPAWVTRARRQEDCDGGGTCTCS
jgi:hypothetical protein